MERAQDSIDIIGGRQLIVGRKHVKRFDLDAYGLTVSAIADRPRDGNAATERLPRLSELLFLHITSDWLIGQRIIDGEVRAGARAREGAGMHGDADEWAGAAEFWGPAGLGA